MIRDSVISICGSRARWRIRKESQPTATPKATSPATIAANSPVAFVSENMPVEIAATAKRYRISAVASFASPSPSSTTRIRRGKASLRAIASGATTSGGATMAPSRKPTVQGSPIR